MIKDCAANKICWPNVLSQILLSRSNVYYASLATSTQQSMFFGETGAVSSDMYHVYVSLVILLIL